jgi:hypothetical protein
VKNLRHLLTAVHLNLQASGEHHLPATTTAGIAANLDMGGEG